MDINYLLFLQEIRLAAGSGVTVVFNTITELGASTLAILVIALTYWCLSRELGIRIGFSVALGGMINQFCKNIFCVSRPWIRDPRITPAEAALPEATGYAFPSGHSQMGMDIYGSIALYSRKKFLRVIFILMALLVGFSRNFLGVHTPQDVLAGLTIGAITVLAAPKLIIWLESRKNNDLRFLALMTVLTVVFLVFTSLKPYPMVYAKGVLLTDPVDMVTDCYAVAALFLGFISAWIAERRYVRFDNDGTVPVRLLRGVIGIAGVVAVNEAGHCLEDLLGDWAGTFIGTFLIVWFVVVIWPLIFKTVEKKLKKN